MDSIMKNYISYFLFCLKNKHFWLIFFTVQMMAFLFKLMSTDLIFTDLLLLALVEIPLCLFFIIIFQFLLLKYKFSLSFYDSFIVLYNSFKWAVNLFFYIIENGIHFVMFFTILLLSYSALTDLNTLKASFITLSQLEIQLMVINALFYIYISGSASLLLHSIYSFKSKSYSRLPRLGFAFETIVDSNISDEDINSDNI